MGVGGGGPSGWGGVAPLAGRGLAAGSFLWATPPVAQRPRSGIQYPALSLRVNREKHHKSRTFKTTHLLQLHPPC